MRHNIYQSDETVHTFDQYGLIRMEIIQRKDSVCSGLQEEVS